jgi:hypothetical protein
MIKPPSYKKVSVKQLSTADVTNGAQYAIPRMARDIAINPATVTLGASYYGGRKLRKYDTRVKRKYTGKY